MANPQKENGYTSISNELFEAIFSKNLTSREIKVILCIIRYTYGFNRKQAELSLRFLSEATNIHYRHTQTVLTTLIEKNIVSVKKESNGISGRIISLNKDFDSWRLDQNGITKNPLVLTKTVSLDLTKMVNSSIDQNGIKERQKKTLKKRGDSFFLSLIPESLNYENFINTWKDWINYRNEIKKKVTESTAKLQFKKLEGFRAEGIDPVKTIHQSIENGWTGLFELKNHNGNGNGKVKPEEFQNNLSLNLIEF